MNDFSKPAQHCGLSHWLTFGQRGSSSNAIVDHLAFDRRPRGFNDPADAGDFARCEKLLRAVPSLRPLLPRMGELSTRWVALAARWDEIVDLLDEEVPGWHELRRYEWRPAPRTTELIRNIEATK